VRPDLLLAIHIFPFLFPTFLPRRNSLSRTSKSWELHRGKVLTMTLNTIAIAVVAVAIFAFKYFNRTDTPKIKGLPEIPGWPIFGSLLELGANHAKVAQGWAKKYGPVFQVRMGNRVGTYLFKLKNPRSLTLRIANCMGKHLRLCKVSVDQQSACPHFKAHTTHFPHRGFFFAGLHHRHFSLG
jgi:hypothetical protein